MNSLGGWPWGIVIRFGVKLAFGIVESDSLKSAKFMLFCLDINVTANHNFLLFKFAWLLVSVFQGLVRFPWVVNRFCNNRYLERNCHFLFVMNLGSIHQDSFSRKISLYPQSDLLDGFHYQLLRLDDRKLESCKTDNLNLVLSNMDIELDYKH